MDIYIFYDYESIHISKKDSFVKMTNSLRNSLQSYGSIVQKNIYFDSSALTENPSIRLDMNQAGWHIVDCPHVHGKKETVDKKILMDIAFSPLMTNKNTMVCLISNDGDFCDILSRLSDRKIYTLLIFTEGSVCQNLLLIPDVTINMYTQIMDINIPKKQNKSMKFMDDLILDDLLLNPKKNQKKNQKNEIFNNINGCIDLLEIIFETSQGDCQQFLTISIVAEEWYHNQYGASKTITSDFRREFRKVRDYVTKNSLAILSSNKLEIAITSKGIEFIKTNN